MNYQKNQIENRRRLRQPYLDHSFLEGYTTVQIVIQIPE